MFYTLGSLGASIDSGILQYMFPAEQEAGDVDAVAAVVDQHATAALRRLGVPAPRHVDVRAEDVLVQHDVAAGAVL